ncbi:FAD-dependent oxidoreductase domain-containing protein 1-like isoform X3 [Periplaneta americana]|uniref:FAD-dependent oxidoreductase domain-containing protein 1-like isoform X3 n=1 Tax=Periplaneta americana TaxID=6978 RepID=UPI0037E8A179
MFSTFIKIKFPKVYRSSCNCRYVHEGSPNEPPRPENPFKRTLRILGNDMKSAKRSVESFISKVQSAREAAEKAQKLNSAYRDGIFPEHSDIAIIGGGAMGSSIAYWLKQRAPNALTITVIEKDPSVNQNMYSWGQYAESSTALSVGGLRQQFSLEENIKMSLFGADFLRNIKQYLGIEGHDAPDVCFTPFGYLLLATEKGAQQLEENSNLQKKFGARNELLTPVKLKEKFPWINTDGIALGCHGLENEGWKRYVYTINCKDGPGLNTPLLIDPSGTYFRREGLTGNYICGRSPLPEDEPPVDNLDVDYDFFDKNIWPTLASRVPAFECVKVTNAWGGYYEYNTYDENGIVGPHPYYTNMYIATGFSGHGIQQSPAVGRAVMEMILDGGFETIDLSRMSFDRFITHSPLLERNIF